MTEQELRIWAIEQVIKHHGGSGLVTERLTQEAEKLLAWVENAPSLRTSSLFEELKAAEAMKDV